MNDVVEVMARGIAERNRRACGLPPTEGGAAPSPTVKRDMYCALTALREAGFAVVPVEPTDAMIETAGALLWAGSRTQADAKALEVYRAMIAAAQESK